MSRADIAVIVTLHGETVLASPSIRSANAAIAVAEAAGFTVERMLGFDSPTERCRSFFGPERFPEWRRIEVSTRDQGLARNAYARACDARWIAFLDGDDLWSENWLAAAGAMLRAADEAGDRVIAHPEINWFFDGHASVMVNIPQDHYLFFPHYYYCINYYDALAMAPRAAHCDHPFALRDIAGGFAVEDWQWGIETMAAGWRHDVVRDTIIFKRRRAGSQTIEAGARNASIRQLTAMRIDRIDELTSRR